MAAGELGRPILDVVVVGIARRVGGTMLSRDPLAEGDCGGVSTA